MNDPYAVSPVVRPIVGTVRPPGSKSITNRALACAALARGGSVLEGALDSDDTRYMASALRDLGVAVDSAERGRRLTVHGCDGHLPQSAANLFVGNSGTSMRFLTALVAAGHGRFVLDGVQRMRERPIGDLASALRQLGAQVTTVNDCPPVTVAARGLQGGCVRVAGDVSSQFLSGLLMAAPYAEQAVELLVDGPLVSTPYVAMTIEVMRAFGARVEASADYRLLHIAPQHYVGRVYAIEPDASAASYFFAAAAISGGEVTVQGLGLHSLQGDVAFCDCLEQMGCAVRREADAITVGGAPLRGVDVDMNAISDTAQTLAVVALFADGPTRICNVGHMRHKETDRVEAVACELAKLGARVETTVDDLLITPGPLRGAAIDTYDDHRMAMSFALAGLRIPGVAINDPQCVSKTYPEFFADLERLTGSAR
jgi:3-phosphoshikimate 1-carboxyvinyltransferase